ncbi:type II secretion system F family protein [Paraburkholderia nodosa]|uniref:type II secretion system F family protein n=1 Tax=Paraburkholderia nodosa TaxID=392320 RepID=UPI000489C55A|nr:type II secretion system F family protein [Paraburkholderia nodosa]
MQTLGTTQWLLLVCLFGGVCALTFGALHVLSPRNLRRRIEQASGEGGEGGLAAAALAGGPGESAWLEKLADLSAPLSKLSVPREGWHVSALRVKLMNAGWRAPGAVGIYFGARTVLAISLPLAAAVWRVGSMAQLDPGQLPLLLVSLAAVGYYLPGVVLSRCIARRKRTIFEDFPDAIDLMTVCVEAGLGLDAAMMKVAGEIRLRSPVVASELDLMLLEMRSGFSKEKALRNFAMRTGVEDIDGFATMLIQAERFGTSIGASLRVLSDALRTRRRMRAEEQAAKIALKLLFPLMFCIFPTLLLVLMGPAFISIYRSLGPSLSGGN